MVYKSTRLEDKPAIFILLSLSLSLSRRIDTLDCKTPTYMYCCSVTSENKTTGRATIVLALQMIFYESRVL